MKDVEKTREQLIEEMDALRREMNDLREKLDVAERLNKVAINREYRIKEVLEENERLKARIEEMERREENPAGSADERVERLMRDNDYLRGRIAHLEGR